jgi:hypothetical protein
MPSMPQVAHSSTWIHLGHCDVLPAGDLGAAAILMVLMGCHHPATDHCPVHACSFKSTESPPVNSSTDASLTMTWRLRCTRLQTCTTPM